MKRIYLDHNATTPLHPEVLEEMLPFLRGSFGNASSIHAFGQEARRAVDLARERVAALIGAEPSEIVFTSGGTEADNHALRGAAGRRPGGRVVASAVEHPAVLNTCEYLGKMGHPTTYLPVDGHGRVDPESLRSALDGGAAVVSVMLANNEVGTVQPVGELARIARERGVPVHTDAVQALGKVPVDVGELGVDLLSMSAHKIYGPKGTGALFVRKGVRVTPLLYGGHHERRSRAGTENVPGIAGFGKACEIARAEIGTEPPRLAALRDRLQEGILDRIPHVRINGHPELRLPNTLNAGFAFVEGESLLLNLDFKGIALSTGSACSSGSLEPSHVLLAMGLRHEDAQGTLRFSLGRSNTEEEIDAVVLALVEIAGKLREMSPLYSDYLAARGKEKP